MRDSWQAVEKFHDFSEYFWPILHDLPRKDFFHAFPWMWEHYHRKPPETFKTVVLHIPLTLMMGTRGLKRDESWLRTSPNNCWCFNTLRIFMIRTMAACKKKDNYCSLRALSCTYTQLFLDAYKESLQVHSTPVVRTQCRHSSAFNHCNSHTMTACKYTTIARRIQCSLVSRLNLSRGKLPLAWTNCPMQSTILTTSNTHKPCKT